MPCNVELVAIKNCMCKVQKQRMMSSVFAAHRFQVRTEAVARFTEGLLPNRPHQEPAVMAYQRPRQPQG